MEGMWEMEGTLCLHPSLARALDRSGQFHVPAAVPLRKAIQQLPTEYEAGCGAGDLNVPEEVFCPPTECRITISQLSSPVVQALYRLRFLGTEFSWVSLYCSSNFELSLCFVDQAS